MILAISSLIIHSSSGSNFVWGQNLGLNLIGGALLFWGAIWLEVRGLDAQILCGCPWKGFGGLFWVYGAWKPKLRRRQPDFVNFGLQTFIEEKGSSALQ